MIYPGTEIYEIARKHGLIEDSFWLSDNQTPYFILEHTYKELIDYKERIRNAISLSRMFSLSGFLRQFEMVPHVLKYALKGSYLARTNVVSAVIHGLPGVGKVIEYFLAILPGWFKNYFKK